MERSLLPLNVVVLPNKSVSNTAIQLGEILSKNKLPVQFVLDPKQMKPHITLYQSPFPVDNFSEIESAVSKIANETNSIELHLKRISVEFGTFIFWAVENNEKLSTLHKEVLLKLNPLRGGHISPHLQSVPLEGVDAKDVEKYGIPLV